jgi:hypothetical protein
MTKTRTERNKKKAGKSFTQRPNVDKRTTNVHYCPQILKHDTHSKFLKEMTEPTELDNHTTNQNPNNAALFSGNVM